MADHKSLNIVIAYADGDMEWNCSQFRALDPANAINYAAEHGELYHHAYDGWKAKLVHISGFLDYLSPAIQDIIAPSDLIIVSAM